MYHNNLQHILAPDYDNAQVGVSWAFYIVVLSKTKGINTPSVKRSVKRHVKRQGPIGMHCDAPKLVPDPFSSGKWSGKCIPL